MRLKNDFKQVKHHLLLDMQGMTVEAVQQLRSRLYAKKWQH